MDSQLLTAKGEFRAFNAGETDNAGEIVQRLQGLLETKVTLDELMSSKIGVQVKKLIQSKNPEVAEEAARLHAVWTQVAQSPAPKRKREGQDSPQPTKKLNSSSDSQLSSPASSQGKLRASSDKVPAKTELKKSQEAPPKKSAPPPKKEAPAPPPKKEAPASILEDGDVPMRLEGVVPTAVTNFEGTLKGNVQRNTFQVKLWQALGTCTVAGGLESSIVAVQIEAAMFAGCEGKLYPAKFRTLYTNISDKENQKLRDALFLGQISPVELINLSPQDLANPTIKAEREQLDYWTTECRKPTKQEATCEMFKCSRCKQSKTTYYQLQTRSADEPMTTFVTCVVCGHHWKFC